MPKWLDENTIEGELPQEKFIEEVKREMTDRVKKEEAEDHPGNYGNDGNINIYEEKRIHDGISYMVKVVAYFAVTRLPDGEFELRAGRDTGVKGMNNLGKHIVIESSNERFSSELRDLLNLYEFLWHDTVHSGMDDWTLKQQWEWAETQAKSDCERIPRLEKQLDEKFAELKKELRAFIKGVKK